jgi:hypothetical protein
MGEFAYQGIIESIMAELQQNYNLWPRETNSTSVPTKNIFSRNKENEAVVTKPLVEKQSTQTKTVEKRSTPTKKTENTEAQDSNGKVKKTTRSFISENEINKIKIPVPLVELAKNPIYKKNISKMINFFDVECHADMINLQYEKPMIMFGPHIQNARDSVAPFYITLTMHDHLLNDCMLDYQASQNLMPKVIMEKLGLDITRLIKTYIILIQEKLNVSA